MKYLCSIIESANVFNKYLSEIILKSFDFKNNSTLENNQLSVIVDSPSLQVNAPYMSNIISKNNNENCVTKEYLQSHVETNIDHSNDEDILTNYEASDDVKTIYSEIVNNINKHINVCSTSIVKKNELLNLNPNPLNRDASS